MASPNMASALPHHPPAQAPLPGVRVCNVSLCSTLTEHPSGKCEAHRKAARQTSDAKRASARARGYNAEWERSRDAYLAAYPWCEHAGCNEPATDVDHIDGQGPIGPRGHDWSNMRSFCHPHHSQRTATDQPGGWNAR